MSFTLHAVSDVGLIRTNNEDIAFLGATLVRDAKTSATFSAEDEQPIVFGVADGVGGANAGEVASRRVAAGFAAALGEIHGAAPSDVIGELRAIAYEIQEDILRQGALSSRHEGMASTFSAIVCYRRELFLVQAGDSRVYRYRNDGLLQLSRDHTLQAMTNNPSIPGNILSNCFGATRDFFVDVARIGCAGEFEDLYLICSDGLSDLVEDVEMESILRKGAPLEVTAAELIAGAKAAGGRDNITVVLARVERGDT